MDLEQTYTCVVEAQDTLFVTPRDFGHPVMEVVFCSRRTVGLEVERLVSVVLSAAMVEDLILQLQTLIAGPLGKLAIEAGKGTKDVG